MRIVFDCDEVILDTSTAIRQCYLADVDKNADIPVGCYSSTWNVWGESGTLAAKQKWLDHMRYFTTSQYFRTISPIPGSIDVTNRLKRSGHDLYVLSAISSDPALGKARKQHVEEIFGSKTFSDVICIDPMDSKKEILKKLDAKILVDDGVTNISDAIELGIYGIWKRCPENTEIMNAVLLGRDVPMSYWRADKERVRKKAIIAKDWHDIERIILNLHLRSMGK
jgi:5'(3')-deoxyribonucleotidase